MIQLHLEKTYRYPRLMEHMSIAIPLPKGRLFYTEEVSVYDKEESLPVQCKETACYEDGSIKFLFVRFQGDLPANAGKEFQLYLDRKDRAECEEHAKTMNKTIPLKVKKIADGYEINNGMLTLQLQNESQSLLKELSDGNCTYTGEEMIGPCLRVEEMTASNEKPLAADSQVTIAPDTILGKNGNWKLLENGPLVAIFYCPGTMEVNGQLSYETTLTVWAGTPWIEVTYRLINTTDRELPIKSLAYFYKKKGFDQIKHVEKAQIEVAAVAITQDSCVSSTGDITPTEMKARLNHCDIMTTTGISHLEELSAKAPVEQIRTCTGYSNYKTFFQIGDQGKRVCTYAVGRDLMMESNEHFSEVFYGTFFTDRTDAKGGLCATIYQAQQNYPKAVVADATGLAIYLVPECEDKVVFQSGVSREQKFLLHFHGPKESLLELDNRSLIYQMPDRPVISPKIFAESKAMVDVFPEEYYDDLELHLMGKADSHGRAFGMLNWGDSMDQNYTNQGRGGGKPVFVNNEYDYPHAMALMYARTGVRRFYDYMSVAANHWMDVDICHYSQDPLRINGQIEHTAGHVLHGVIVPSHEWVEGLLDYYHLTGDHRAYETAMGIGENVRRLLESPMFTVMGEASARETGWALRTMTALYVETNDVYWLEKCEWIVDHFRGWEKEFGHWYSMYTDNTVIRVGFMISVAVGSLARYYRVRPNDGLKEMILRQIDDLVDNGMMTGGIFYYKELPSLQRMGSNTLLLEAMAIGYELSGDTKYLKAGLKTFQRTIMGTPGGGVRKLVDDAILWPGESTKSFAQSFLPIAYFYRALEQSGMVRE